MITNMILDPFIFFIHSIINYSFFFKFFVQKFKYILIFDRKQKKNQQKDKIKLLSQMKFLGCTSQINASGNGSESFEICSMIKSGISQNEFVTIAHDGMVTIWDLATMKKVKSARIKCGYLTSLISFQKGFIVGTGSGELIKFTSNLQRQWSRKIHHDCVTDMLEIDKQIVTIGSDGRVCFLSKIDFTVEKQLDFTVPLSKITRIGNQILVASNPSFIIDLITLEVREQRRSLQFIEYEGKILSCSDQNGLQVLNNGELSKNVPCHYMLHFCGKLITISEQIIGVVDFHSSSINEHQINYRFYKTHQLKKGYAIKAGLAFKECILLAGEEGFIYKFSFQIE